jgi:hypothetical protein
VKQAAPCWLDLRGSCETGSTLLVGFEVFTAVVVKSSVFWDITSCSLLKVNRRFGETRGFRLHNRGIRQGRSQYETGCKQSAVKLSLLNP